MDSLFETRCRLEELMPLIRESLAAGRSVRFSPRGVSMLPMLRQGRDTVRISPAPERLRKYDIPLYQRKNGQYVLHRVVKAGQTYTCAGDNQFVLEHGIAHDQVIGVVTAFCRDGREIPVDALGYRIYCRFWHGTRSLRRLWRRGRSWLGRIGK